MALRQRSYSPGRAWDRDYPLAQNRHYSLMDQLFNFPDQLFEVPSGWLDTSGLDHAGRTTELINTANQFKLNLGVEGFKPEELDVKVVRDRFLVVHGKHAERRANDATKSIAAREFTRSFVIPNGVDLAMLKSNWNESGVLVVEAPKKTAAAVSHERAIPIEFTSV